jgi:hypothetical protein
VVEVVGVVAEVEVVEVVEPVVRAAFVSSSCVVVFLFRPAVKNDFMVGRFFWTSKDDNFGVGCGGTAG